MALARAQLRRGSHLILPLDPEAEPRIEPLAATKARSVLASCPARPCRPTDTAKLAQTANESSRLTRRPRKRRGARPNPSPTRPSQPPSCMMWVKSAHQPNHWLLEPAGAVHLYDLPVLQVLQLLPAILVASDREKQPGYPAGGGSRSRRQRPLAGLAATVPPAQSSPLGRGIPKNKLSHYPRADHVVLRRYGSVSGLQVYWPIGLQMP